MADTASATQTNPQAPASGASTTGSSPALMVTSSQAQGQYNSAVANMQKAQANTQTGAFNPATVDTNLYAKPGEDYNAYETRVGAYQATKNAQNGQQGAADQSGSGGQTKTVGGNAQGAPPTSGSSSTSTPTDTSSGTIATPGLDPALSKAYNDSIDGMTKQLNDVQSTIDSAKATAANDPALQAALDQISQKYNALITDTQNKNKILLGNANTSMAAFGGLGPMSQSFLSDETARADKRVSDLQAQEDQLKLQTKVAYDSKNAKAVTDLQNQYDKLNMEKATAIKDLLAAVTKQQQDNRDYQLKVQTQKQTEAHQNLQDTIASMNFSEKQKQDAIDNAFKAGQITETQRHNLAQEAISRATALKGRYSLNASTGEIFDTQTGKVVGTSTTNIFNGTATPGKTGNPLLDNNTQSTSSGVPFVDGSNFTGKQSSEMQLAAAKLGIPYVGKTGKSALDNIAAAKSNADLMGSTIDKLNPSDLLNTLTLGGDRLLTTGVHGLEHFTQVGPGAEDVGTYSMNKEAAIKAIQGLAAGGTGVRINQAEINQMMSNLPSYNDTKSIAKGKLARLKTLLDNNERQIVGTSAYEKYNPTPASGAIDAFMQDHQMSQTINGSADFSTIDNQFGL